MGGAAARLGVLAGLLAAGAAPAPPTPALNDPWRLSQNPDHPWRGTPRADIADHRNGAEHLGEAVFSDPRWAGRAIAIELRDFHRAGARSANDYAERLAASCRRFAPASDCGRDGWAQALARAVSATPDGDLGLFGADDLPTPRLRPALTALALAATGAAPAPDGLDAAEAAVAYDDLGQSEADFVRWRDRDPARAPAVSRFEERLAAEGVANVAPAWQLLRTASDWRGCGAPFEVPPPEAQAAIVPTLRLVRSRVAPALGPLEAKSAYRSPWLNVCAGGAERSAHRDFAAVDLTPLTPITRGALMARLCPIYVREGEAERMGLGFYAGMRFHVDTWKRRSWATENGRPYAPCAADGGVNPPLPPLPDPNPLPPAPPSR